MMTTTTIKNIVFDFKKSKIKEIRKMVSQEDLFDFFQKISIELENQGYPILNNIIHPFPKIKFEEDIIKENMRNHRDNSDSEFIDDGSDHSGDDIL